MKTSITYKDIWVLSLPIIIGSIAQNIINVTDTAFLGRVGQIELGAGAIAGMFYYAITMLGWGFGVGAQIIIARRFGEGNINKIGQVVGQSVFFLIPLALSVWLMMFFGGESVFNIILKSPNIAKASTEYMDIRIFGIFFVVINYLYRALHLGIGRTKIIIYTTIVMAIVNVGLDYILIFGKFGFEPMGIKGAAIASVAAEVAALIYFIVYTYIKLPIKEYHLFQFNGVDFTKMLEILKVAFPVMIQNFVAISGWFVFFLLIEHLGELPIAVSNVIRSVYIVILIPIMGFSSATNTLVSQEIGRGNSNNILNLIHKISLLSVISILAIVALSVTFPYEIMRIYTNDPAIIKAGVPILYTISGASILLSISVILFNGVSGTGSTKKAFIIESTTIVIYLSYVYAIANFTNSTITTIWTSEYIYAIFLGGFSYWYLLKGKWHNKKV
ncbi:MAG: MATE family efflux transporter [Bacteroidales bacterium]|nr:MATE family efflux transporter [Bacteroidales bacterium]